MHRRGVDADVVTGWAHLADERGSAREHHRGADLLEPAAAVVTDVDHGLRLAHEIVPVGPVDAEGCGEDVRPCPLEAFEDGLAALVEASEEQQVERAFLDRHRVGRCQVGA